MGCLYSNIPPSHQASKVARGSRVACQLQEGKDTFYQLQQLEDFAIRLKKLVNQNSQAWRENSEWLNFAKEELEQISVVIDRRIENPGNSTLESFIGHSPPTEAQDNNDIVEKTILLIEISKGHIVIPDLSINDSAIEISINLSTDQESPIKQNTKSVSGNAELIWSQLFKVKFKPRENLMREGLISLKLHGNVVSGSSKGKQEYSQVTFSFSEFKDQRIHSKMVEFKREGIPEVNVILKFQLIHDKSALLESWKDDAGTLAGISSELLKKCVKGKEFENALDEDFSIMSKGSFSMQEIPNPFEFGKATKV